MSAHASTNGGVISSVDARALIAAGAWCRLRRGVYGDRAFVASAPDSRHLEVAASVLAACAGGTAVTHLSAVRLLGLPTPPGPQVDEVSITRRPPRHGNPPAGSRIHVADFDDDDLILVDGVPVLGGPRLALDCAMTMQPPDALAVADAMLRRGMVTSEQLDAARRGDYGRCSTSQARRVLELADGGAESWFESASRWWLVDAGLPRPALQHVFTGPGWQARVDMWFEDGRVVGEADGAMKYAGPDGQRALVEEKRREDRIRDEHGVRFVRWMPTDIATATRRAALVARLWSAVRRGRGA
jgi:hypothetical protein